MHSLPEDSGFQLEVRNHVDGDFSRAVFILLDDSLRAMQRFRLDIRPLLFIDPQMYLSYFATFREAHADDIFEECSEIDVFVLSVVTADVLHFNDSIERQRRHFLPFFVPSKQEPSVVILLQEVRMNGISERFGAFEALVFHFQHLFLDNTESIHNLIKH